jgi:hypothetical protein
MMSSCRKLPQARVLEKPGREFSMQLILVPAIITLVVTLLRLAGERLEWSRTLFNPAPGGGFALVGIAWLVPIFGIYFALKLARRGEGPARPWRALGMAALGIVLMVAAGMGANALHYGFRRQLVAFAVASVMAVGLAWWGWPALGRTLVAYGLAARIPVALVMLVAILGNWGTHYDVVPPEGEYLNRMAPVVKWFWIGLVPQMTAWIMFTVVLGTVFGVLAVALLKPRAATAA